MHVHASFAHSVYRTLIPQNIVDFIRDLTVSHQIAKPKLET